MWGVRSRALSPPDCPPSGPAAGDRYPLAVVAGGCGRGDPSPTPQRAVLRAGFARCGGGTRVPGGGASCLGVGRPGSGALPTPTAGPLGGLPGPTTHWLWVRGGAGVGTRHQPHSAGSCVLWGQHEGARGGRLLPGCGASGVGRSPTPDGPPSGRAAGAHYPLAVGARGCGRGDPSATPQRALLRAGFARCGGGTRAPGGGASCLGLGRPGSGTLPPPTARPLGGLPGPTTHWLWMRGGAGVGTRHQPHSARSCVLWGRHEGAPGGRLLPGCGASGFWRSPTPDCPPSGRAAGAHYPLAVGGGVQAWGPVTNPTACALASWLCVLRGRQEGARGGRLLPGCGASGFGRSSTPDHPSFRACCRGPTPTGRGCGVRAWGPGVLGTLSLAAVRRVLCALPRFAAPGGRCGLVPVLVPWLWPAACLSGVPRGPALVRRSSSGPVALGAPVGFPVAVVPSPTPGAVAPGFTGWLRGARGGWPRTGLIVPAAGPCQGKGAGRSSRRTRSGPRDGVVPGGSFRLWSWAACAAVVWRLWTRSLTRPVSRTVRLATGDSAGAPGLFRVDVDTAPFGSEDATPRSRACVRVRALLGRFGRAGLPGAFWCAPPFLWPFLVGSLLVRPPPGWCCPVCGCCWVFFLFFVSFPLLPLVAPPLCPAVRVFRPGVPWALASCPPPPFPPPPPCCLRRFRLPVALGLCAPPPPFFFLVSCFFFFRFFCVCSVCSVRCAVRVVCAVSGGWCCWFLVSLPFVWGLLVALVARRCRLVVCVGSGARVWSGRRWASSLWCPVPLCCVLWRCAAVWRCAVVPCLLFFCFSPCWWHLVSCCSPLVLGSGPAPGRFCFCAMPVRCCAGVPASLLSVRCPLALAGLAGVLCCCLLCLCVCCWAWLSSVVSWWVLVPPGVVSRWRAVACPWVLCCAVLLRIAPPGVACCALCCFVLLRLVLPRAVLCPGALSVVLGSCACWRRVLSCPPALCLFCCVVSPRGVVRRCALCRVRPGVSCCAFPVVSALCGVAVWPALLGALLPCAVPRGAVLPRGAAVSCPAALLGLFLAWVWLYLLEKPLQNFVKYFYPLFLAFENKIKLYTTQHTRVQQDHVRCSALRATRRS